MPEERRLKTGHLVAALALVVLGVLIGWVTDAGDGGKRGEQPTAGVGPTRTVDGISVGYERSREGAVAAALAYATALARPEFITDEARRSAILDAVATPEAARRSERRDYSAIARLPVYRASREGRASVWQTTPLAYRLGAYSGDDAQVSIWSMAITGAGAGSPVVAFGTGALRLTWRDGDWKFAGDVGVDEDGPTPVPLEGASPTSTDEFRERLRGLEGVRHVP
jgi:hypothetical protein